MAAAGSTVYSFTITGVIGSGTIGVGGYTVSATLVDRYTTAPEALADLPSKKIWFDLHSSGEGVAIGKVAGTASLFDVGIPSTFQKAATFAAGVTFAGVTFGTPVPAAPPMLGFGGVRLTCHIDATKMGTTTTNYVSYYDVAVNTPALFTPWKISGQTYYNGVQVLVAGWYIFNGRATFGGVTAVGHGRLNIVAMDASNAALLTAALTGSANSLPSAILDAAIDAYSATSDYETGASLMCKATKVFYLPANAIVATYLNAQTANLTRDDGFFELCRVG
jgi:hypothetical protein